MWSLSACVMARPAHFSSSSALPSAPLQRHTSFASRTAHGALTLVLLLVLTLYVECRDAAHGSALGVQRAYALQAPPPLQRPPQRLPWDSADAECCLDDVKPCTGEGQHSAVLGEDEGTPSAPDPAEGGAAADTDAAEARRPLPVLKARLVRGDFNVSDTIETGSLFSPDIVHAAALEAAVEAGARSEEWPPSPPVRLDDPPMEVGEEKVDAEEDGRVRRHPTLEDAAPNMPFRSAYGVEEEGLDVTDNAALREEEGAETAGATQLPHDTVSVETGHVGGAFYQDRSELTDRGRHAGGSSIQAGRGWGGGEEEGEDDEEKACAGGAPVVDQLLPPHLGDGAPSPTGPALPTRTEDVLVGADGERGTRDTRSPFSLEKRQRQPFDTKREVQARWRDLRDSYPTLRELIGQLVEAYKEEQRVKQACWKALVARRRKSGAVARNGTRATDMMLEAECAAQTPRLRSSLDWVRYLPYVPIYPIDEALQHLEHERDDDILLSLFYAPDIFNTYNYIQWIGLMVKATCSLLRAGVLDPIADIGNDSGGYRTAFANTSVGTSTAGGRADASETPALFCPHLTLPATDGLLDAEDVQRLRTNMVRIAIIDGYYPQRNVSRRLWEHIGTDTYMVEPQAWDMGLEGIEGKSGSSRSSNEVIDDNGDYVDDSGASPVPLDDPSASGDLLSVSEMLQRSSEEWGPVFVEQRNALLRLLAHEGDLFAEVQGAPKPSSRPWGSREKDGMTGAASVAGAGKEGKETAERGWRPTPPSYLEEAAGREELSGEGDAAVEQMPQQQPPQPPSDTMPSTAATQGKGGDSNNAGATDVATGTAPSLHAMDALNDNNRIHFLARYILKHTDALMLTRPSMLLDVLQRSFDRARRREQRVVEKIFSWGQIMKYRVHVNVSAQHIDKFSSDHLCGVRRPVYLHSPQSAGDTGTAEEALTEGGDGSDGARRRATPTFLTGEQRAYTHDPGGEYDIDGFERRSSCSYYQQLRNSRTKAALGSVSGLLRKPRRPSASPAATTSDGGGAAAAVPETAVQGAFPVGGAALTTTAEGGDKNVDVAPELQRHTLHHQPPTVTLSPLYRKAPSDPAAREGAEEESDTTSRGSSSDAASSSSSSADEEDGVDLAYLQRMAASAKSKEDLYEVYVQYVDGIDEISIEENEYAGSSFEQQDVSAAAEATPRVRETTAATVSVVRDEGEEGDVPHIPLGPRSAPGTPVSNLRLTGAAARRNYLLRQNPPVLLFPRKQGSRPYFFPQTLLQMVHVSFAGPRGQLLPREHATRLRRRWGCEEDAAAAASAAGNITPSSCTDEAVCAPTADSPCADANCKEAGARRSSAPAQQPAETSSSFSAFSEEATTTMAALTPFTYRVVSVLDNPFSRIGLEHLHYEFVIGGPSSPISVLQLLIEEARRVSAPGELEVRSHREALYRLQQRQWRENQRTQRLAVEAAKRGKQREKEDEALVYELWTDCTANTTPRAGSARGDAVSSTPCAPHAASEGQQETVARTPPLEMNQSDYDSGGGGGGDSSVGQTWRERFLASAAKDLYAYLQQESPPGCETSSSSSSSSSNNSSAAAAHNCTYSGSPRRSEVKRSSAASSGPHGARQSEEQGSTGGSGLTSTLTDEVEEDYFFEHNISFRLDPNRFIKNVPLTLHFFLRTPTQVVETEIIEPLKEHIRILQQRLLEDIVADAFQYARCQVSGNRFMQLLRHGADAHYVNGTRVLPVHNESDDLSVPPSPPPLPYAYTEDGLPLLRCMRDGAAIRLWRLAAEMQAQELRRSDEERGKGEGKEEMENAKSRPVPLPRDAASYLELLVMPYGPSLSSVFIDEARTGDEFFPADVPLLRGLFRHHYDDDIHDAEETSLEDGLTKEEREERLDRLLTQERLLLMQLAFRELLKRSMPGSTESFFHFVVIDREAAMPIARDDPSRIVHRTLPSSIRSVTSLPVADPEPVRPRECLSSFNNTYTAITYLFFNSTAERCFREHPLNRRRVRLMQRLDEAVRLSRQARLILLTATEDDYRAQYLDSVIQDAARRFFVIRQDNRNRDTAVRDWELHAQPHLKDARRQQEERQQHEGGPPQHRQQQEEALSFSAGRGEADDAVFPSSAGANPSREEAGWRPALRSDHSSKALIKASDDGGYNSGGGGGASSAEAGEDDEGLGLYERFAHLSPFQLNIINYDVDANDDDPLVQRKRAAAPAARREAQEGQESASSAASAFSSWSPEASGASRPSRDATAQPSERRASSAGSSGDGPSSFADPLDVGEAEHGQQQMRVLHNGRADGSVGEGRGRKHRSHFRSSPGGSGSRGEASLDREEGADGQQTATAADARCSLQAEMVLLGEEMRRLQRAYLGGDDSSEAPVPLPSSPPQDPRQEQQLSSTPKHHGAAPPPSEGRLSRWRSWLFRRGGHQRGGRGHDRGKSGNHPQKVMETSTPHDATHRRGSERDDAGQRRFHLWQRWTPDLGKGGHEDFNDDNVQAFSTQEGFEQRVDDDAEMAHVITGGKAEYQEGLPFPWRDGEMLRQELRRRQDEHQRHVRELKRRLIDVRLRWASALWNEQERPGAAQRPVSPPDVQDRDREVQDGEAEVAGEE